MSLDPDNGVARIKRQMGTDHPLHLRGREHTPESISALILRQLVDAAGIAGQPAGVITVPAYFGLAEREATAQAAIIAGINVLELLDEPVAAAMHYAGVRRRSHSPGVRPWRRNLRHHRHPDQGWQRRSGSHRRTPPPRRLRYR